MKKIQKRENFRLIPLMNLDTKILNKILTTESSAIHIKIYIIREQDLFQVYKVSSTFESQLI
jgi:hypothetical protein